MFIVPDESCDSCYQILFNVTYICIICNKRKTQDLGFGFQKNSNIEIFTIFSPFTDFILQRVPFYLFL